MSLTNSIQAMPRQTAHVLDCTFATQYRQCHGRALLFWNTHFKHLKKYKFFHTRLLWTTQLKGFRKHEFFHKKGSGILKNAPTFQNSEGLWKNSFSPTPASSRPAVRKQATKWSSKTTFENFISLWKTKRSPNMNSWLMFGLRLIFPKEITPCWPSKNYRPWLFRMACWHPFGLHCNLSSATQSCKLRLGRARRKKRRERVLA